MYYLLLELLDYGQDAAYFISICTKNRVHYLVKLKTTYRKLVKRLHPDKFQNGVPMKE